MIQYRNRTDAGKVLAKELQNIRFDAQPVVLAIPNGGVPVGLQIAKSLNAKLDAIIVRKLQVPGNSEAGFGALTSHDTLLLNHELVRSLGLKQVQIEYAIEKTRKQIERRREDYRGLVGIVDPAGKEVILVDDGLASGYTMLAAIESVRTLGPKSIIVAAPTSSNSASHLVGKEVDVLICPRIETGFIFAVANAYVRWYDVPDSEVIEVLEHYRSGQ